MTAEQFFAETPERHFLQLVDGAVVVNEPRPIHVVLQGRLYFELRTWIEAGEERGLVLLPVDVRMGEYDVYAPDLCWIAERHRPASLREQISRVPDLCVEVRSPGTWRYDVGRKKAIYEAGGLPELWLVDDVAETVLVFRRSAPAAPAFDVALELTGEDELSSPQLPGFSLPLQRLFEGI
jgi:Uma2 family endonuclease